MKLWIVNEEIASKEEVETIEKEAKEKVHSDQKEAWDEFLSPILKDRSELESIIESIAQGSENRDALRKVKDEMLKDLDINRKVIAQSVLKSFIILKDDKKEYRDRLTGWYSNFKTENEDRYSSTLMMEGAGSALNVKEVKPVYSDNSPSINGSEILKTFFDKTFESDERVFAIGEDVGKIGDVNQGMAGLQEKYGELRVTDTGIRESTIIGQGIGAAMRGLKPIVEIQYLDYLLFGLQPMSDDIATLLYRTKAGQKCPVIVRTRGHRLEGIWHTGSPMGMIINSLRGMHVCVPRNMTQAAGMYKTILQSDDPALIVERLNAYRLKEKLADNIGEYNVPLGVPEIITEGEDITIVTYGACVDIAKDAIRKLSDVGVSCELIDVQTLLPFDVNRIILESLKKTNRILFLDEDVPGGASAYMLHNVLDVQGGYQYLDSKPVCLAAKEHRSAYGTDGDYFSKPNAEDVFRTVYNIMHETNPELFSLFF
jgi:Pyruvate/2-oxoglutarate dehydrogenase complex, dehydrogenase (E1) component, eukaryotic type, beta subunit